jgi:2-amino-4-hydroxy-6-hydroxymethyldihydropteridine diphosphokinase
MTSAYLSLGSNLGDRAANLQRALHDLGSLGRVTKWSSFYETEPVEFTEQPWFLNCAVELETSHEPLELLAGILAIERSLGRIREESVSKGPRILDIDILLYEEKVVELPELTVPHPAMHLRRFVLEPLAEIAGDVRHPVLHSTVRELLERLGAGQKTRRVSREIKELEK